MDEVGAQDCESCSQIPAAVLFHALERIEVEHPTLWMLSSGSIPHTSTRRHRSPGIVRLFPLNRKRARVSCSTSVLVPNGRRLADACVSTDKSLAPVIGSVMLSITITRSPRMRALEIRFSVSSSLLCVNVEGCRPYARYAMVSHNRPFPDPGTGLVT